MLELMIEKNIDPNFCCYSLMIENFRATTLLFLDSLDPILNLNHHLLLLDTAVYGWLLSCCWAACQADQAASCCCCCLQREDWGLSYVLFSVAVISMLYLRSILLIVLMIGIVVRARGCGRCRRSSWSCAARRWHTWPGGTTWTPWSTIASTCTWPSTRAWAWLCGPGRHPSPAAHASWWRHTAILSSILLVGHGHLDGLAAQPHLSGHTAKSMLLLLLTAKSHKSISFAESWLIQHNLMIRILLERHSQIIAKYEPTLAHLTVAYLWVKYLYNAKSSTSGVKSPTQIEVSIWK